MITFSCEVGKYVTLSTFSGSQINLVLVGRDDEYAWFTFRTFKFFIVGLICNMRRQEFRNFSAQILEKVAIMTYFSHNTLLC